MRWSSRVRASVGALLVCISSEALACDVTGWRVSNEGPRLAPDPRGGEDRFTNTCDEAITLVEFNCASACADELELGVGETKPLSLPSQPQNGQVVEFFYVAGAEEFTIRFEYLENVCPSEEGCAVARRGR